MKHQDVQRHLAEGIQIERNSPLCLAIRDHLRTCTECSDYLHSLEKITDCFKQYAVSTPSEASSRLRAALAHLPKK
jgi:hypothetical protein